MNCQGNTIQCWFGLKKTIASLNETPIEFIHLQQYNSNKPKFCKKAVFIYRNYLKFYHHETVHPIQSGSLTCLQSILPSVRLKIQTFCCVINQISALRLTFLSSTICYVLPYVPLQGRKTSSQHESSVTIFL